MLVNNLDNVELNIALHGRKRNLLLPRSSYVSTQVWIFWFLIFTTCFTVQQVPKSQPLECVSFSLIPDVVTKYLDKVC